jgi:hypothetical protein
LRKILALLTKKAEDNTELFEKIVQFSSKDLDKNILPFTSNGENEDKILNDTEILSNIVKYPITPKLILKQPTLANMIFSLFSPPQKNPELQLYLTNIIKYLTRNSTNNEEIIQKYPIVIPGLVNNLANAGKPEFQIEKQIFKNELEAYVNLVGENFRQLIDNNILPESDIKAICEMHQGDIDFGEKLKEILKALEEYDESQQKQNSEKKDVKKNK